MIAQLVRANLITASMKNSFEAPRRARPQALCVGLGARARARIGTQASAQSLACTAFWLSPAASARAATRA